MRPSVLKKNKRQSILLNKKIRNIVLIFLIISNLICIGCFVWSILPVPEQSSTIQMPDTFSIGSNQINYQFPLKRELTVSYPEMIRYGDIQEVYLSVTPKIDPQKCDEFCQEKHLTYENIWATYKINMIFSFELNNLIMEPMGETTLPLAKSSMQDFYWKIKAVKDDPGYLKNTIYMQFAPQQTGQTDEQLVFARELTIPVKRVGPFSFPIFRIICVVWIISTLLWLLLNHRYYIKNS